MERFVLILEIAEITEKLVAKIENLFLQIEFDRIACAIERRYSIRQTPAGLFKPA